MVHYLVGGVVPKFDELPLFEGRVQAAPLLCKISRVRIVRIAEIDALATAGVHDVDIPGCVMDRGGGGRRPQGKAAYGHRRGEQRVDSRTFLHVRLLSLVYSFRHRWLFVLKLQSHICMGTPSLVSPFSRSRHFLCDRFASVSG